MHLDGWNGKAGSKLSMQPSGNIHPPQCPPPLGGKSGKITQVYGWVWSRLSQTTRARFLPSLSPLCLQPPVDPVALMAFSSQLVCGVASGYLSVCKPLAFPLPVGLLLPVWANASEFLQASHKVTETFVTALASSQHCQCFQLKVLVECRQAHRCRLVPWPTVVLFNSVTAALCPSFPYPHGSLWGPSDKRIPVAFRWLLSCAAQLSLPLEWVLYRKLLYPLDFGPQIRWDYQPSSCAWILGWLGSGPCWDLPPLTCVIDVPQSEAQRCHQMKL